MWTEAELAELVQSDTFVVNNEDELLLDYSPELHDTIMLHGDEISCDFNTNDALISNFARFRVARMRRERSEKNWMPDVLRHHFGLMSFVLTILSLYYENSAFIINFSPVLIIKTAEDARVSLFFHFLL